MPLVTWADLIAHRHGRAYPRHPRVEAAYTRDPKDLRTLRTTILGRKHTALVPNKYPYWTTPDIHHWILWSDHPLSTAIVQKRLERDLPPTSEFIWFTNAAHLQSIPGLWHAHVFWRYPTTM
jgi:hypothetical protein